MFNAFRYYIRQAFESMFKNTLMVIISISTTIFCLLLLGMAIMFGTNLSYISQQLESQFEIHAFVDLNYTQQQATALEPTIRAIPGIADVKFSSKQDALNSLKEMLDDTSALAGLEEDSPLEFSYKITLTDISQASSVEAALKSTVGITSVSNRTDILNGIISFTSISRYISIAGMILFAFIAIFIISNTIKLALMSRKREIRIMKSVGATNSFIRNPFIIEGIVVGLFGGIIAFVPAYFGYEAVFGWWTSFSSSIGLFKLVPLSSISPTLLIVFLVTGAVIGATGSITSVRKYLKA